MELSDLRRWHWIVIGALLGLIIGYSLNAIGPDAMETGAQAAKTSQTTFESELIQDPAVGPGGAPLPIIRNITVYPDGPINLIKMQRLVLVDPNKPNSIERKYQQWFYEAHRPYSPMDWRLRTDVRVKPGFPPDGYQMDENWRDSLQPGATSCDPGSDGAQLFLSIAKGNCDLVMQLDDGKQASDLTVKFNDHPLVPFTVDPTDSRFVHTTIPADYFGANNARALWIARKDNPVHIHQIHIYNPTYTVLDYLNAMAATHPDIHYRYAWWMEPKAVLWLSVGGCVLVIGIIWPTVLNLLVGAGFGPPPREKGVSLRNLKATPVSVPMASGPTEEDMESLAQMEEDLIKDLESTATEQVGAGAAPTGPAPVRVLNAKAAEPPPLASVKKDDKPKSFAGEFYPVARKTDADQKKDEQS
jgi:hypothetical protein